MFEKNRQKWLYSLRSDTLSSVVAFLVVLATLRTLNIQDSRSRANFFLIPLLVPVLLTAFLHFFLPAIHVYSSFPRLASGILGVDRSTLRAFTVIVWIVFLTSLGLLAYDLLWLSTGDLRVRGWKHFSGRTYRRAQLLLEHLSRQVGLKPPRLALAEGASSTACAAGILRPVIYVSPRLACSLDDEELKAVLAHELMHVKGRDSLNDIVAKLGRDMMFFNPLAHFTYRAFVTAKEEAADDGAICLTGNSLALAGSLLKAWRQLESRPHLHSVGLLGNASRLERRVRRALSSDAKRQQPFRVAAPLFIGLTLFMLVALALAW